MEHAKPLTQSSPITIADTNEPKEGLYKKQSVGTLDARLSCKTLKTIAKNVGSGQCAQEVPKPDMFVKKRALKDVLDNKPPSMNGSQGKETSRFAAMPIHQSKKNISPIGPLFFQSDTYRCIMKGLETVEFVKKVKTSIEVELNQRLERCAALKHNLLNLVDQERHLAMAIDGVSVQNDMDLDNLQ